MSQYTSLHVLPTNANQWMPDRNLIGDILDYLGCDKAWVISGYSKPKFWDDEGEAFQGSELFMYPDVSIEKAMGIWSENSPVYTFIGLTCEGLTHKLNESTINTAETVSECVALYNISMSFGPFSIPSLDYETTVGNYCFQLKLGGSGMPCDSGSYFEVIRNDPVVLEILSNLKEKSGKEWDVVMSCSY